MTDRYAIEFYSRLNDASGLTNFIGRSSPLRGIYRPPIGPTGTRAPHRRHGQREGEERDRCTTGTRPLRRAGASPPGPIHEKPEHDKYLMIARSWPIVGYASFQKLRTLHAALGP
jgi:hypothetical protein